MTFVYLIATLVLFGLLAFIVLGGWPGVAGVL